MSAPTLLTMVSMRVGPHRKSAMLAVALLWALAGCSGGRFGGGGASQISLRSQGDTPAVLSARLDTSVYAHDEDAGTMFLASDLTESQLVSGDFREGMIVHVELLWVPSPGDTPIDRSATNASIRQVIFADGQLGIYAGAGFAQVNGKLGASQITLNVRESSLSLVESTDGFVDLLGPAGLTGTITATHEPGPTRRLYYNVSQHVTNTLGKSRFVDHSDEQMPTDDVLRDQHTPSSLRRSVAPSLRRSVASSLPMQ